MAQAASQAERAADLARRRARTPAVIALESFGEYAASIRRAIGAIPAEGRGDGPACIAASLGNTPELRQDSVTHGRFLIEPWARRVAATEDMAGWAAVSASENPGGFVNDNYVSTAVAFLASLTRDPEDLQDQAARLAGTLRALADDGPLLRIVRVEHYAAPNVAAHATGEYRFTPGRFDAVVFVVDRTSGRLRCTGEVHATNSPGVSWRPEATRSRDDEATSAVAGDLHLRVRRQLEVVRASLGQ